MKLSKADLGREGEAARVLMGAIAEAAVSLGLDRIAAADPAHPTPARDYEAYLAAGRHADMHYLSRHREVRLEPERFLSGVRAILCSATSYHCVPEAESHAPVRISRYALGCDYHRVIKAKLHALLAKITTWVPGTRGRVAVDTAPVLERYWAAQAGVGWIGHNGCLIVPGLGPWVFLGEIFLDIPLPFGAPLPGRCGTCRRCLDACPTGALRAPYVLDARRCIAYWTIEHRGAFPPGAPRISPWLFGCDVCLEVCPWAHKAVRTERQDFRPRWPGAPRDLSAWCALSPEEFAAHLADTPMERAGHAGLMRNAEKLRSEVEGPGTEP